MVTVIVLKSSCSTDTKVPIRNPKKPTMLIKMFLAMIHRLIPSLWKVTISRSGGMINARVLLLTDPTSEITISKWGIKIAKRPRKSKKRFSLVYYYEKSFCLHAIQEYNT